MAAPLVAVATAVIPLLAGLGTLVWHGYLMYMSYRIIDVVDDVTDTYEDKTRYDITTKERLHALIDQACIDENLTAEECASRHAEIDDSTKEGIFDNVGKALGISADTAKFIVLGLIGFLLLKG